MVYSTGVITGTEALAAQRRLALHPSFNLNRYYSKMCEFVRSRMSLEIVTSNILLLQGPLYKEARIHNQIDLMDGAVMTLFAPWQV